MIWYERCYRLSREEFVGSFAELVHKKIGNVRKSWIECKYDSSPTLTTHDLRNKGNTLICRVCRGCIESSKLTFCLKSSPMCFSEITTCYISNYDTLHELPLEGLVASAAVGMHRVE